MPRTLRGQHDTITFTNLEYLHLMKMLYRAGWKPLGTLAPAGWKPRRRKDGKVRRWPKMNYFSRMGQAVMEDDARTMAAVLRDILPDIPSHDAIAHKIYQHIDFPYNPQVRLPRPGERYSHYELLSGEVRERLERFATMCENGGFEID